MAQEEEQQRVSRSFYSWFNVTSVGQGHGTLIWVGRDHKDHLIPLPWAGTPTAKSGLKS